MGTTQTLAAERTRDSMEWLIYTVGHTAADRFDWSPMGEGRTAQDLLAECALTNQLWSGILRDRTPAQLPEGEWLKAEADCDTPEKALARLRETTGELIASIEAFPDAALEESMTMPWGEGYTCTYRQWLFQCAEHMVYHIGQIHYIQTLYGDKEMR